MPSHRRLLVTTAVIGMFVLALAPLSRSSDDTLSRAALQMREKDFGEALTLAAKSPESPRRSFLMGVASLRQGNPAQALPLLAEAEQKLTLVADYAVFYQAEALMKLKKFSDAATRAAYLLRAYPQSELTRRTEKLQGDALFEAGDHAAALKLLQAYVEKYPSGGDSVDALFTAARCREATGDKAGALMMYRSVWLNNPNAPQAAKSKERLAELEKNGAKVPAYTADELLKRASTLFSQNEYTQAARTLREIDTAGQPASLAGRVELKSGMASYKLRNWKQAEKELTRAAASRDTGVSSEARFWLARTLERQEQTERAYTAYMELVAEGKKQEYADDALLEAAGLRRSAGSFSEAVRLYGQLLKEFPESKHAATAAWGISWSRYLAGDYAAAAEAFKGQLKSDGIREKALYWLARSLEQAGNAEAAAGYFRQLQDEFPAGFYTTWYRNQHGIRDSREGLGGRNPLAELPLPSGYDKPLLLASLGLLEEARSEASAVRRKNGEKKTPVAAQARLFLEMGDYGGAVSLFQQNRPAAWDKSSLPLWSSGYPLVYAGLIAPNAAASELRESLVYALVRAESAFNPSIKSHAGAVGLMQLMPATAKQVSHEKETFDPQRLTDPGYNVKLGTRHLRELIKGYGGEIVYAVAAYNAGSSAVDRWRKNLKKLRMDEFIESIPYQETRDYVKKVYASAATYQALYGVK